MQTETVNKSRRRVERISLTIPVRVDCQESKIVSWSEITRFHSISAIGADLSLTRKVMVGQLLLLTSSFPSKLRRFDYSETQYRVWTLVRHCKLIEASGSSKESFLVGLAFIGQYPPQSYRKSPDKRYLLSNFNQAGFCEISEIFF